MPGSIAFPLCELVQRTSLWDSLSGPEQTLSSACTWTHLLFSSCCVRLFETPWTAAHQASLSYTISQSLLKLMSNESVMPTSHLILLSPSPPAFNLSQHQGLFQWVDSLPHHGL